MQAKWHNLPFRLAKLGAEAGLPPVGFTNANLMVTLGEIELGKPLCPPRLVKESVNVGKRFYQGFRDGIKPPIVVADPPRSIRLAHKDNRSRMARRRRLYPAAVQQIDQLRA